MSNKHVKSKYDLATTIKERWSPRSFSSKEISDKQMMTIFEAGRWAASSNNGQPWRFMWVRKGTDAWDKAFACLSDFNQTWVINAPILILTAYKKQFDNGKDNFHALHDLGLAVGNMSMQAQSMGIALHQMAGVNWKKAHEEYDVPEGFHVATAIAVGYYGGDPAVLPEDLEESEKAERSRKELSTLVFEEAFKLT